MRISTIAFDAYGTLFDTANGSIRATREILLKNDVHLDASEVYKRWKSHHKQIISSLPAFVSEQTVFIEGLGLTYKDFGITGHPDEDVQIMLATLGARKPFPDAGPCLDRLRGRFEIVIASNTDSSPFLEDLRNSGLLIDRWFTSASLQAYKPHQAFYDRMLSSLHREAQEVVFVGDSLDADVLAPAACGMHSIWLNRKGERHPDGSSVIEISTLSEFCGAIATWRQSVVS